MNNNENKLNMIDLISVISFLVGLENLYENRQQSEQNDVQSANDRQAKFLLEELGRKFEEQNELLRKILERIGNDSK